MVEKKLEQATTIAGILKGVSPEPLREEELDKFFYKDTMKIRMGHETFSPVRELFEACIMPSISNAHLLMGHRGCGKTTELQNLKREFEKVGHRVHMVDTRMETDNTNINHWDILLLATEGLCTIAEDSFADIPTEPFEAIYEILCSDIKVEESSAVLKSYGKRKGFSANTPAILDNVLNLFITLKSDMRYSTETRTNIITAMPKRASAWLANIREISRHLTAHCKEKQPIIIFEGLDKIHPPNKIIDILNYSVFAQMPIPIIYTFPIDQCYSTSFAAVSATFNRHVLPMIKIRNINKTLNERSFAVIRAIVELRADLKLFDKDVLDRLIEKTGGSLRHLFECIVRAARLAAWRDSEKIGHEDANRALAELSKEITKPVVEKNHFSVLRNIMNNPRSDNQIKDLDSLLGWMNASIVLEYENGERWIDVHPLVADFISTKTTGESK
ncbi:MAG: hypothetical protein FWC89_08390 [Defluviitaleaceae bacterium]|nr:hypothetical protein [Defluviitaleaceae bacterium]